MLRERHLENMYVIVKEVFIWGRNSRSVEVTCVLDLSIKIFLSGTLQGEIFSMLSKKGTN